jgi:uncharacterized protein YbbK (DUF523 family)
MKKITIGFFLCLVLTACLYDSGTPWKGGPYMLLWIDDPKVVTLSYDLGDGASTPRVDAQVFSVGYDGRYVVAKQHPHGRESITNYFIIDAQKDSKMANNKDVVMGPLNKQEFQKKVKELSLPAFTKTLESLQ